ncbi:shikimate dehydrogenase family protein [Vreelandella nigrificans]|uniref:shikimate dehydrogenase (NADP(+)) n=1 Tax=Vreelandella nigrificans TaxID=2042704 RepID=A0A2A4HPM5_9GAMM|nr:shikimate dehydrogenase [Halomonas nigrificans]PCF96053.1 shikimate dehydrogenase [Halomonas nigrificans]
MNVSGKTKVCFIIADPIEHVKTPEKFNDLCKENGIDAVMVPAHVHRDRLEEFVKGLSSMQNLAGFVVTVPHKSAMSHLCDQLTEDARCAQAVNVVRRTSGGHYHGYILDGKGFVAGLKANGFEPKGRSVYLVGSGGAASAIAFALAEENVSLITIFNRTLEKAEALIYNLKKEHPNINIVLGDHNPAGHDLVVNATSLGLRKNDPLPLNANGLTKDQVVADIIMDPSETHLLKKAKSLGCMVQPGLPMLNNQLKLMLSTLGL